MLSACFYYGCDVQEDEEELNAIEEFASVLRSDKGGNRCSVASRSSCPNNLVLNGCDFEVDGSGIFLWQNLGHFQNMLSGPNNCRIENLPAGCSWGSNEVSNYFFKPMNGCCYPASSLTHFMNQIKATAGNNTNRPGNNYKIRDYDVSYEPNGGAPRLRIKVTYRNVINCSRDIGAEPNSGK